MEALHDAWPAPYKIELIPVKKIAVPERLRRGAKGSSDLKKLVHAQVIAVRPSDGGGYELLAGAKALMRAKRSGCEVVAALVTPCDPLNTPFIARLIGIETVEVLDEGRGKGLAKGAGSARRGRKR